MKKVVIFFIVAMVVFGACSAQRVDAQNANNAQRIIGTWVDQYGSTWVFNANGNLTNGTQEYKFAIADTKLVRDRITDYGKPLTDRSVNTDFYDISMSSDGKTLLLIYTRSGITHGLWLTKK